MKSAFGLLVVASLLCGTIGTARADDAPKVLAAVKFPPVKTLSDELMGLARKLAPGQQTEFLPMMILGPFGYPAFPGVSETASVTVYFFEAQKGEEMPFVIMAQVEADAMLKKALTMNAGKSDSMMGLLTPGFVTTERDGWTFFSDVAANFDYVTDVDALEEISDSMQGFDINTRVFIGPENMASWTKMMKNEIADAHVLDGGRESDPKLLHKQLWVDYMATIGENLEWISGGLDITADNVSLGWSVQAIEGSPEHEMLSMPAGGEAPIGNYVAASTLSHLSKWDMAAVTKYYDVLETRGLSIATEGGREWIKKTSEYNRKLLANLDGTQAGSLSFADDSPVTVNGIGGSVDSALLNEVMSFYYGELMPYLVKQYAAPDDVMQIVYKANVDEVEGQPVSLVETKSTNLDLAIQKALDQSDDVYQSEMNYFTAIGGDIVSASVMDQLSALAKRVAEEAPAEENIAQRITLKPGEATVFQLDMSSAINLFIGEIEVQSEVSRQALKSLAKDALDPVVGSLTVGEGQGTYLISAPVSTLEKIAATRRQIEEAEEDMQSHGGATPVIPPASED